ncbi:hypothetical protein CLOM_g17871 [Closterium sp. NIES-68]|nr:hypothetical protein CLOM_g17871 [Closterium sp. NIES-68]
MVPELQAWAVSKAVEGAEGEEEDLAAATSMEAVVMEDMAATTTTMATGVGAKLRHNKLDAKATWAVHLGMAQNSKGWLLWDPFTKKFLVSRDCKFMENLPYKEWKAENQAKIGVRLGERPTWSSQRGTMMGVAECGS